MASRLLPISSAKSVSVLPCIRRASHSGSFFCSILVTLLAVVTFVFLRMTGIVPEKEHD